MQEPLAATVVVQLQTDAAAAWNQEAHVGSDNRPMAQLPGILITSVLVALGL